MTTTEAKNEAPALQVIEGQLARADGGTYLQAAPDQRLVPWTDERIQLIKTQIVRRPDCPDDAFRYFIEVCKRADLDPMLGQAFLVERKNWDDNQQRWVSVWAFQAAESGMEARADRFPDYRGIRGAAVYEKDQFEIDESEGKVFHKYDPTKDRGKLLGAWAHLRRDGRDVPITWLPFESRVQRKKDRTPTKFWANDPEGMIRKCARAEQLRLGYPNAFGGVYVEGEIGGDDDDVPANAPGFQPVDTNAPPPPSDAKGAEATKARVRSKKDADAQAAAAAEKAAADKAAAEKAAAEKARASEVQPVTAAGEKVQTSAHAAQPVVQGTKREPFIMPFGGPDYVGKPITSIPDEQLRQLMVIGNKNLNDVTEKKVTPEPKWVPGVRAAVAAISMELALRQPKQQELTPRQPGEDDVPF